MSGHRNKYTRQVQGTGTLRLQNFNSPGPVTFVMVRGNPIGTLEIEFRLEHAGGGGWIPAGIWDLSAPSVIKIEAPIKEIRAQRIMGLTSERLTLTAISYI